MSRLMRFLIAVVIALAFVPIGVTSAFAQPPEQPEQQEEFVPLSERPPQEELPAAGLVIGAYSFVVLVLFAYLLSVSRRLGAVARDIDRLEADVKRGTRA